MMNKSWSEDEINFLKEKYSTLSSKEMSCVLGKTVAAIRNHLRRLNIINTGIEIVCRFCDVHFIGHRKDLQRGCCKKAECIKRNRLEKNLAFGVRTNWSAQKKWSADNREKLRLGTRVVNLSPGRHEKIKKSWRESYWKDPEKARKRIHMITSNPDYKQATKQRHREKYNLIGYNQVRQYAKANGLSTSEARKILYEHFEGKMKCSICGRTADQIPDLGSIGRRGFHIDHADGNRTHYQLENLQVLCWKCNTCKLDMPLCDESKELIKGLTDIYYKYKVSAARTDNGGTRITEAEE